MRFQRFLAALALSVCATASAAAPVFTTDAAGFDAAFGALSTRDGFDDAGTAGPITDLDRPGYNIGFSATRLFDSLFVIGASEPGGLTSRGLSASVGNGETSILTFTFDTPVQAFGISLFDVGTVPRDGAVSSVAFILGDVITPVLSLEGQERGQESFVGFVDPMMAYGTVGLQFTLQSLESGTDEIFLDDLRFAAQVPLPASGVILLAGIGALAAFRLRRS